MRKSTKALEQFFEKARAFGTWQETAQVYSFQEYPPILCNNACPLKAVANNWIASNAARILGISPLTAQRIANAADGCKGSGKTREWLKRKLGMRV